jgi:hypothetical protein
MFRAAALLCRHDQRQSELFTPVSGKFARNRLLHRAISLIVFHRSHFIPQRSPSHALQHRRDCRFESRFGKCESLERVARHFPQHAPRDDEQFSEGLTPFVRNVHGDCIPEYNLERSPGRFQILAGGKTLRCRRIDFCLGMDDPCK